MQKTYRDGKSPRKIFDITENQAVIIARKFLIQYHSPVIFKSACLNEKTWDVSLEVGLLKDDIIVVRVDATTGKILGYDHLASV
ncbi:MAG TPA: hypothetical protein VJ771_03580 [Candidatus Nitrosotalea sp.]|nr:hypothetical protein [Candidatus Nitrosotalea sp.]